MMHLLPPSFQQMCVLLNFFFTCLRCDFAQIPRVELPNAIIIKLNILNKWALFRRICSSAPWCTCSPLQFSRCVCYWTFNSKKKKNIIWLPIGTGCTIWSPNLLLMHFDVRLQEENKLYRLNDHSSNKPLPSQAAHTGHWGAAAVEAHGAHSASPPGGDRGDRVRSGSYQMRSFRWDVHNPVLTTVRPPRRLLQPGGGSAVQAPWMEREKLRLHATLTELTISGAAATKTTTMQWQQHHAAAAGAVAWAPGEAFLFSPSSSPYSLQCFHDSLLLRGRTRRRLSATWLLVVVSPLQLLFVPLQPLLSPH